MKLYHGSNVIVDKPRVIESVRALDFGSGYYTTTNKKQAMDFASKVMTRTKTNSQFVSVYEIDLDKAKQELDVLQFSSASRSWLDFVMQNRRGKYAGKLHDVIISPVANDDVYTTLQLYEQHILNKEQTLSALKIKKLYDKIVFCNAKALASLTFIESFDPRSIKL
ncbi:hypothetical protein AGMMS49938_14730 [Fibrobacterales bacterium]|nr:hypothetical protein AGMMS49938_14630 [Fibrobacterales bacterium]GHV15728.1 hypothetical protein AGMMS49938_14730 [Fibrobacterales bacterium]